MGLLHSGGLRVAQTADGRLAIFALGTDATLQSLTQSAPGAWTNSGWTDHGGILTTNPVVFPARDGRLEVFARGLDNNLQCCFQTKVNGGPGDWAWKNLKGQITNEPGVYRNQDDRMEVVAANASRGLEVTFEQGGPGGTWWSEEGKAWPLLGGRTIGQAAIIQSDDGRLTTFHRGGDKHLYEKGQNAPNGGYRANYSDHGGVMHSEPTAILNGDGTMHVFAIGPNGGLYHLPQLSPNGAWGRWEEITAPEDPLTHRPAAVLNSRNDIEVFARCHNTHLSQYRAVNGAWTRVNHDASSAAISGPTAARNADGRLEVFYRNANAVWHTAEFTPGGPWTQHASLGGRIADL